MPTPASDIRDYQTPAPPQAEYCKAIHHIMLYNGGSEKMAELLLESVIEGDCPWLRYTGAITKQQDVDGCNKTHTSTPWHE